MFAALYQTGYDLGLSAFNMHRITSSTGSEYL